MNQTKLTVSNILIAISAVFTLFAFANSNLYIFWMNDGFFQAGKYNIWIAQMFSSQFLHGSIMHIVANSFFILYFWNVLEKRIGAQRMLVFFITCSMFLGILITFLSGANTVWISGFALAVLTYYTLLLRQQWNPEYMWWVTAIVLNILIGLSPGISFLWHFWGMVYGFIFWSIGRKKK